MIDLKPGEKLRITTYDDGTKTAKHALAEPVTYDAANESEVLQTLESKSVGNKRHLANQGRRGSLTGLEALLMQRGADFTTLNLVRQFQPTPRVQPSHPLTGLIDELEERQPEKLPRNRIDRLRYFAQQVVDRETAETEEHKPSPKAAKALEALDALVVRLVHDDVEKPERLVRAVLTREQLLHGDESDGLKMYQSTIEAEKQIAAERSAQVALKQDELRREAADLDQYSNGLQPVPAMAGEGGNDAE